jgi:osmotically-inducible protein OsmY
MREFLDDGRIELRSTTEQHSDERLRTAIRERLGEAPWLDSSGVEVTVEAGKVRLEGHVPEPRVKQAIQDIVAGCPGVQDIDNRLDVTAG